MRFFLVLFLALTVTGCGSSSIAPRDPMFPPSDIAWRRLSDGSYFYRYEAYPDADRMNWLTTERCWPSRSMYACVHTFGSDDQISTQRQIKAKLIVTPQNDGAYTCESDGYNHSEYITDSDGNILDSNILFQAAIRLSGEERTFWSRSYVTRFSYG